MSNVVVIQILRFCIIILFQGLILSRIHFGLGNLQVFSIMLYPVLIMLLPMKISRIALLGIGFLLGITMDLFYGSLGVHASACVFLAFARPMVLQVLEPRGGYPVNASPTLHDFNAGWYLRYAGSLLLLHLTVYFLVEVFNIALMGQIVLKILASFIVSFLAILMFTFLFNPKR
jgi:hypothetical protein